MSWALWQTLIRTVLKAGAGALIARGVINAEESEQLIGAIVLALGVLWGIWQRATKRPPLPPAAPVIALLLIPLLPGCVSYATQRPVFAINPTAIVALEKATTSRETNSAAGKLVGKESSSIEKPVLGTNQVLVGYERTSFRSFLMMGQASKIQSLTKDRGYSRSVTIGAVQAQGDQEMLQRLIEGIGTAAGIAAKTAVKP